MADTRDATATVAALYAEHALGLIRLAQVMLGDRAAAEDVVNDAFCGLCRRWDHLTDPRKAPAYLRSSVLNGCRSALRRQARGGRVWTAGDESPDGAAPGADADGPLLASEDRRAVLAALRRLPHRQREVLVLRRVALPMSGGSGFSESDGFSCDSDPILSANGKYILCGGWLVPKGYRPGSKYALFPDAYPHGPVTQGFAEFSAATGRLITILGTWRAPLPTARVQGLSLSGTGGPMMTVVNLTPMPRLLWASGDAATVIGTANGRGITVHDGRTQAIPWSSLITVPAGSSVPGAAW